MQLARVSRKSAAALLLSRPPLLRRRLVHHGFELHAVGVGEIDRVIGAAVIFAGRIDHGHAVRFEEGAERVHVVAARPLEGVVVKAGVALAVLALLALRIGGGDPEQRLAVAPAGHVGVVVFELEAEKAEQLAVELLRAREVADAEHQVIDADDAGHGVSPLSFPRKREPIFQRPACIARWVPAYGVPATAKARLRAFVTRYASRGAPRGDDTEVVAPLATAPAAASRRACRRGRRSSVGRDDRAWIPGRGRGPLRRAWVCADVRAHPSPPPAAGDPRPACGERVIRCARSRSPWRWGRR